jgi:hypothetical protein
MGKNTLWKEVCGRICCLSLLILFY